MVLCPAGTQGFLLARDLNSWLTILPVSIFKYWHDPVLQFDGSSTLAQHRYGVGFCGLANTRRFLLEDIGDSDDVLNMFIAVMGHHLQVGAHDIGDVLLDDA